jgi:hypothetical protein
VPYWVVRGLRVGSFFTSFDREPGRKRELGQRTAQASDFEVLQQGAVLSIHLMRFYVCVTIRRLLAGRGPISGKSRSARCTRTETFNACHEIIDEGQAIWRNNTTGI